MPASFYSVVTSVLHQLAQGVPLHKISVPASIHAPLSALEIQRDVVFSNQRALEHFDSIHACADPVERLLRVLEATVDPHAKWIADKPFNPILVLAHYKSLSAG